MLNAIKQYLVESGFTDTIILENPSYETAIVGISENEELIYDYDLMVEYLVNTEKMTYEEADDFISYNTLRTIPYMHGKRPIIMYHLDL